MPGTRCGAKNNRTVKTVLLEAQNPVRGSAGSRALK